MLERRLVLWLLVNAALTVVALYTAYVDIRPKEFPESFHENAIIGAEGIVAWIASFVVWKLRQAVALKMGRASVATRTNLIFYAYLVAFALSVALYASRVLHSEYR